MELFIALVLFLGMVICWFVLPAEPTVSRAHETEAIGNAALQQLG